MMKNEALASSTDSGGKALRSRMDTARLAVSVLELEWK